MIDSKSDEWRSAADRILKSLAEENKFIVADMVIIYLEAAGFGQKNYAALGGVFKRAAKQGLIKRVERPTRQALWQSLTLKGSK